MEWAAGAGCGWTRGGGGEGVRLEDEVNTDPIKHIREPLPALYRRIAGGILTSSPSASISSRSFPVPRVPLPRIEQEE